MKARPLCAACILLRRAAEIEMFERRSAARISWFRSVAETVGLYVGPDIEVALLATMSFRRLKSISGLSDPYREYKERLLEEAMRNAMLVKESVEKRKDPVQKLDIALKASAMATLVERSAPMMFLSMGGSGLQSLADSVEAWFPDVYSLYTLKVGRNDTKKFASFLLDKGAPHVAFLPSSILEMPYDRVVLDVLRNDFNAYIVVFARSGAYEDYATVDDLEHLGITESVDEIVSIGSDAATVLREESEEAFRKLESYDVVVVKGTLQSIYFHNNRLSAPTLMLLYTSCPIAAATLGVQRDAVNIVFREPEA